MLTSTFNPLDPQLVEDPYTVYREAREQCPVHHFEPMGMYAALSWDAVWTIIREGRAEARFEEREIMRHGPGVVDEPYFKGFQDFVILKDGEEHARLRKSFAKHLTPPRVAALRGAAQAYADELVDSFIEAGRVELMNAYARPLPLRTISDLLGVPVADYPQLERWLHDFKPALNFLPMSRGELDACNAAVIGLRDYFIAMIEERRVRPGGDLLSAMISETDAGNITDVELATNAYVLYFAGHDTTADMIGNGMDMLAAHPDQLAELQADMSLFDGALVELLRVCAPGQANIRTMPEDIVLDGETVPAGCPIGFYFASANRDPKVWEHPDAFDIHRPPKPHLTFSSGPHVCPGRHLATATVDIGLRTLVRRLPAFRLGEPVEWSKAIQTRGPDRIVIEWEPPPG